MTAGSARSRVDPLLPHSRFLVVSAHALILVLVALGAMCLGRYTVSPHTVMTALSRALGQALGGPSAMPEDGLAAGVVLQARLPRICVGVLVGAGLAVSGASYQSVFRNPLISPGLLGVLAGSGFGAALAIVMAMPPPLRYLSTFLGGCGAVALGLGVSLLFGEGSILLLVFGGLVSGALFTALLSLLKYVADPASQLPDIVFWLLGTLSESNGSQLRTVGLPLLAGVLALVFCGRFLDVLAMGDEEALSLGVPVGALRLLVIALATATSALTVMLAGMIGWVGLVVPHVARLMWGPGNRLLMPVSACLGGMLLLAADTLARSLTASEIPLGIVTDILGVVLFLLVLPRARQSWSR